MWNECPHQRMHKHQDTDAVTVAMVQGAHTLSTEEKEPNRLSSWSASVVPKLFPSGHEDPHV